MDPLTLATLLTIFPNEGMLKPLTLEKQAGVFPPPMSHIAEEKLVAKPQHIQLVTKILNDREAGVEQFGLKSNLNLQQNNYAVKTGTSRNYHDSWTVGYTPDYVVVVWLGNTENEPLEHVTGQSGAGTIWKEVMQVLQYSEHNKNTPFSFAQINDVMVDNTLSFGLPDEIINEHKNLLLYTPLITHPHDGDIILLQDNTSITLRASEYVSWKINNDDYPKGNTVDLTPTMVGNYIIEAKTFKGKTSSITIHVTEDQSVIPQQ